MNLTGKKLAISNIKSTIGDSKMYKTVLRPVNDNERPK